MSRDAESPFPELAFSLKALGPGCHLMTLAGELDMYAAQLIRNRMAGHPLGSDHLIITIEGVPYIDSSGTGFLVDVAKDRVQAGCRSLLVGVQPRVRRVLEMTGADRLFDTADSIEAAQQKLASGLLEQM